MRFAKALAIAAVALLLPAGANADDENLPDFGNFASAWKRASFAVAGTVVTAPILQCKPSAEKANQQTCRGDFESFGLNLIGQDPLNGIGVFAMIVNIADFSNVALGRNVALILAAVADLDTARDWQFRNDLDMALASRNTEFPYSKAIAVVTQPNGDGVSIFIFRPKR